MDLPCRRQGLTSKLHALEVELMAMAAKNKELMDDREVFELSLRSDMQADSGRGRDRGSGRGRGCGRGCARLRGGGCGRDWGGGGGGGLGMEEEEKVLEG